MIKPLLLFLIGATFPLFGLIEQIIDPTSAPVVSFSTTSPNRVIYDGGAIVDLIFDESKFESFLHQKTGQVFISVKKEIKDIPTSITFITNGGESQTIQVYAKTGPGEIILLKDKENIQIKKEISTDYHSHSVDFLNTILAGGTPYGYGVRSVTSEDTLFIPSPFEAKAIIVYEGPFETILVAEIQNKSRQPEPLKVSTIKRPSDLWVFLTKTDLHPGEKILSLTATKKEY